METDVREGRVLAQGEADMQSRVASSPGCTGQCYGLNCVFPKFLCGWRSSPPEPQKVTSFGNRAGADGLSYDEVPLKEGEPLICYD